MKIFATIITVIFLLISMSGFAKDVVDWKKVKVLVYTKNGKGYVHENVPYAVRCQFIFFVGEKFKNTSPRLFISSGHTRNGSG